MSARLRLATLVALVAAFACDDDAPLNPPTPSPANEPPVITGFRPEGEDLDVFIGDNVDFVVAVSDPEGGEVASTYYLDGEVVSHTYHWRYAVSGTGPVNVRVLVSDGVNETEKVWHLWRRDATAAPVVITHFDRDPVVPGGVELRWVAGMDNDGGALTNYRVRTSLDSVTTNAAWNLATAHPDVPPAAAPGEEMSMVLTDLPPKEKVFVAVRGVGSLGQFTVLGESPSVVTVPVRLYGEVFDAMTGTGLSDVVVHLGPYTTTTDATGAWSLDDLPVVTGYLQFTDDDGPGPGAYYDNRRSYVWQYIDRIDVHLLPVRSIESTVYSDFLTMFLHFVNISGIPYPLGTRRWELPLAVYVPPRISGGLDYQAVIVDAMLDLEQLLGRDVFELVSSPPATGFSFEYDSSIDRDRYDVLEWTQDYYPKRARVRMRTLYDSADIVQFRTVVRHELGHVLGMINHSADTRHLMVGGQAPLVTHFTADELAVLNAYLSVPRGTDLSYFIND